MPRIPSGPAKRRAFVIGSGPNGLAAAIVLAQAGLEVEVFEAEDQPGGAARTLPLTLPGFHHDFGSAVHPLAVGSPFFSTLPLDRYGLQWVHPSAPLAHPFDDGSSLVLEQNILHTAEALGDDGPAWQRLLHPLATDWSSLASDILRPALAIPKHPSLLTQFGVNAVAPATLIARRFHHPHTRALFAGLAAHSFLSLHQPLSAAFGLVLGALAHAVGWPIPRGGAQSLTNALLEHLRHLGGRITTSTRIADLAQLPPDALILCDISPGALLHFAGDRFTPAYRRVLTHFQPGPGAYKIDYALSQPIPWTAPACLRSATVHLGGSLEEIAASESAVTQGRVTDRPFVLLVQPTLIDSTRAPEGRHIAWVYCHVPNNSSLSMLDRIERQIERFAPGFRDCVLARRILAPADLQAMDTNLVGGDVNGGDVTLRQFLFRPSVRQYRTPLPNLYLCSASTPPGGGVHGMCGCNAARTALHDHGLS